MKYADSLKTELEKLEIRCSSQPQYPGKSVIQAGKRLVSLILPIRYPNEFSRPSIPGVMIFWTLPRITSRLKNSLRATSLKIFDRAIRLMGNF